jgi:motility quorum-sensing regulator / GCU-specific mRNA interferase toxin
MEKLKPTYDLESFRSEFSEVGKLRTTRTARDCAFALGMSLQDMVDVVQSMKREHFYKSMTSNHNARIWQDVYHVPFRDLLLYVKLTVDDRGKLLLSPKEK